MGKSGEVGFGKLGWASYGFCGLVEIMGGFVRGFLGKKDEGMQERRE